MRSALDTQAQVDSLPRSIQEIATRGTLKQFLAELRRAEAERSEAVHVVLHRRLGRWSHEPATMVEKLRTVAQTMLLSIWHIWLYGGCEPCHSYKEAAADRLQDYLTRPFIRRWLERLCAATTAWSDGPSRSAPRIGTRESISGDKIRSRYEGHSRHSTKWSSRFAYTTT